MNKILISFLIIFSLLNNISCSQYSEHNKQENLVLGADRLIPEFSNLINNKRIGIVTNQTAVLSNKKHLVEVLLENKFKIKAIFSPEHGITGKVEAGKLIDEHSSLNDSIKIISLYGKNKKPTSEMLKNIDVLIFDIQDIGTRFYTYISTLYYVLQSAAENKIPLIVLDRPNPINGNSIEGPVIKEEIKSFIGIAKLPIIHGMTIGEIANYFAEENLIETNRKPVLKIIQLKNWNRKKYYDEYFDFWIKPSPNIPDLETAIIYPGTCLIEGTNISEGRGTENPFKFIGAPFINSSSLFDELKKFNVPGIRLDTVSFTPVDIPGVATDPKYENEKCNGLKIKITNRNNFNLVEFGIKLIYSIHKIYPEKFKFIDDHFDHLIGNKYVRMDILNGLSPDEIIVSWKDELQNFINQRKTYLLY